MVPQQRRCTDWEHCTGHQALGDDYGPHDSRAPEIAETAIWVRRYLDGSQVTILEGPSSQPLTAQQTRDLAVESVRLLILHGADPDQVDAAVTAITRIKLAS